MKRIVSALAVVALAFAFVTGIEVKAAGVSGSMSGPSSAEAGETITLRVNVDASKLTSANGQITYDVSQATVNSASTPLSNWYCGFNEDSAKFILNDNSEELMGVSGSQTILNVSVTLSSDLTPGESVSFSVLNCEVTYDGEDLTYGTFSASHTVTISEPVVDTPSQDTPSQNTPSQSTPSQSTPSQNTPSQSTPSQSTPSQDEETPLQSVPSPNEDEQSTSADEEPVTDSATETDNIDVPNEEASEEEESEEAESDKDDKKEVEQEETLEEADNEAGNQGIWIWVVIVLAILALSGGLLFWLLKRRKEKQ